MVKIVIYEDNKLLFQYESNVIPNAKECIYYNGIFYRVVDRIYVISENIYNENIPDKNYLSSINLNVIEIES